MIPPLRWLLVVVFVLVMASCAWLASVIVVAPGDDPSPLDMTVTRGTSGQELVRQLENVELVTHPRIAYWYLRLAARPAVVRGYAVPKPVGDIPMP